MITEIEPEVQVEAETPSPEEDSGAAGEEAVSDVENDKPDVTDEESEAFNKVGED